MTEEDRKHIEFKLDYLSNPAHVEALTDREIDRLISFQEQWERTGRMTENQLAELDRLWVKSA